jgi:hypothetical protein
MKNTTKHFLLIAPLVGLFAASCGDNFSDPVDAGPFCIYAGHRYSPDIPEQASWKAKDGCNICTCGFKGQVMCSQGLTCDEGGTSDALRSADAGSDRSEVSDVLISASDGFVDKAQDAAVADVPVGSDARILDAPVDFAVSDGRLPSERD